MYSAQLLPDPHQHHGWCRLFSPGRLTVGLMCPIESFHGDSPSMEKHAELARAAESAGFAALWGRDVPLRDPSFGDVGQVFETFSYLGFLAAHTREIVLGTAAVILPLRHPLHTAKAAASIDRLSGGRLVLGVASGDRPLEFPAFGKELDARGRVFRDALQMMKRAWGEDFPWLQSPLGAMQGVDLVPKATTRTVPLIVTGRSQQDLDWIAANADGWMSYPRSLNVQRAVVAEWERAAGRNRPGRFLPFAQSLYIDLCREPAAQPEPIHLGWRLGRQALVRLLGELAAIGVNHVALNLKYGQRPAAEVMDEIAGFVLPQLAARTFAPEDAC